MPAIDPLVSPHTVPDPAADEFSGNLTLLEAYTGRPTSHADGSNCERGVLCWMTVLRYQLGKPYSWTLRMTWTFHSIDRTGGPIVLRSDSFHAVLCTRA